MTTKETICAATKREVLTRPFSAITVTTIMQEAGLRRQTFYDHFRDKYDVLAYIYQTEVDNAAAYCRTYRYWPQTVARILQYFAANGAFYRQVLMLDVQNAPAEVIQTHFAAMFGDILHDMGQAEHLTLDDTDLTFTQNMLAAAMFSAVKAWLLATDPAPLADETAQLQQYLADQFAGLLQRLNPASPRSTLAGWL
ncbi:TetR/AcrR family transcriptional regulator C-terminal domain-containing protein [Lacticaseibacillus mingshuiensis]|uniref:TetR/AcrR family transcriptional regulator C-terminal domain-containing protein n=1 Tax=Lacticaseibacillus mingshuiensis TaxID=2799574 RepID=A0ABW4CM38_9LACO|nr:TetR/AcrR family transcriptional regulator C-terminal domain-containing protein [Lacticaseibacillus mingshuiensis]